MADGGDIDTQIQRTVRLLGDLRAHQYKLEKVLKDRARHSPELILKAEADLSKTMATINEHERNLRHFDDVRMARIRLAVAAGRYR